MNRFVLTDLLSCIGCLACETACVLSHNDEIWPETKENFLPRVTLLDNGNVRRSVMCHQCDDAPCVVVCPTDALIFRDDHVKLIEEKCIGCKNCVLACPFGVISVINTKNEDGLLNYEAVAHKCDLCEDKTDGPACVNACPTNAIQYYDESMIQHNQQQKQLRTMLGNKGYEAPKRSSIIDNLGKIPRKDADKIAIEERKTGFDEIYVGFTQCDVEQQGERCITCGDHAYCEWTCPVHNQIPHWIKLAKEGKILEAVELCHQYSSLPEVCGRVCPQDRLCEGACTLDRRDLGAVTIGNIEKYITDTAFEMGWKPDLSNVVATGKRVAIIGAGPSGLGCADVLTKNGIKAVVFDRHPEIGGMLTFGIPSFKLDKNILVHRRELFTEMGIEFHLNTEIGKDISFDDLMRDYDAVFVGVGAYQSTRAGLANEKADDVYDALLFLTANTKHVMDLMQLEKEPYVNTIGKKVVVLGGGDTAMDCVRTSIRQGAEVVTCAYRRDEVNMPGSKKEVKNAKEEGVEFLFNVQPLRIVLNDDGKVSGIEMVRTEMGAPDASGRRRPQKIAGSEFILEADIILQAFGFSSHAMPWLSPYDVNLDKWGGIDAARGEGKFCQTSNAKIFAGGDVVRGADLVVTAMSDGRRAAEGIIKYLQVQPIFPPQFVARELRHE